MSQAEEKMDLSLDDLITKNKRDKGGRGGGRGRGRGGRGGDRGDRRGRGESNNGEYSQSGGVRRGNRFQPYTRPDTGSAERDGPWKHDKFDEEYGDDQDFASPGDYGPKRSRVRGGRASRQTNSEFGTKLIVSNLEYTVSEKDVKDLFAAVGSIASARIKFDRTGRSEGSAEVTFTNSADARTALKKYNGLELDGKAMRISMSAQEGDSGLRSLATSGTGTVFDRLGSKGHAPRLAHDNDIDIDDDDESGDDDAAVGGQRVVVRAPGSKRGGVRTTITIPSD
eukprot:c4770_g1_i1.p1 GENE.c4770_g1_i1~~c4770_g1_i1.p1  ORF type:complete len:282 (-),score=46.27 c4770_g1_i1:110-955(-)